MGEITVDRKWDELTPEIHSWANDVTIIIEYPESLNQVPLTLPIRTAHQ